MMASFLSVRIINKNAILHAFCFVFLAALMVGPGFSINKIYFSYFLIGVLLTYLFIFRRDARLFGSSHGFDFFVFYSILQIYIISSLLRGADLVSLLRHDLLITASIFSFICAQIFVRRFYSAGVVESSLRFLIFLLIILGLGQSLFVTPNIFYGNANNLALILLATLCITSTFERGSLILLLGQVVLVLQTESRLATVLLIPLLLLLAWTRQYIRFYWLIFGAFGLFFVLHLLLGIHMEERSRWSLFQYFLLSIENNGDYSIQGDSIGVRLDLLKQSFGYLYSSPWFGIGPGELSNSIASIHENGGDPILITNLHNPPIEFLVDYGALGMLIWFYGFYAIFKVFKNCNDVTYKRMGVSLFFVILLGSLLISSIYYFVPMWALMGVAVGLVARNERIHT